MGNDIGTGSVTVCLLRSETDLKLHTLLIKFLYWTSDQKAIKVNNVGHIYKNKPERGFGPKPEIGIL